MVSFIAGLLWGWVWVSASPWSPKDFRFWVGFFGGIVVIALLITGIESFIGA